MLSPILIFFKLKFNSLILTLLHFLLIYSFFFSVYYYLFITNELDIIDFFFKKMKIFLNSLNLATLEIDNNFFNKSTSPAQRTFLLYLVNSNSYQEFLPSTIYKIFTVYSTDPTPVIIPLLVLASLFLISMYAYKVIMF